MAFEFQSQILYSLFGALGLAVLETGARYGLKRLHTRAAVKFWKPWLENNSALTVCSTIADEDPARTRGTGPFDCLALQEISSMLIGAGGKLPPTVTDQFADTWVNSNVIAIAGPASNRVTAAVLSGGRVGLYYNFDSSNRIVSATGQIIRPATDPGSPSFTRDSGLLCRLPHPFEPSKSVLIIAGCWGQGTLGGARALTIEIDELWQRTRGEFFQVVYDVELDPAKRPHKSDIDWSTLRVVEALGTQVKGRQQDDVPPEFEKTVRVVIPCKNEEGTVGNLVREFKDHRAVREIVVVDNGSIDKTSENANKEGALVVKERRTGKGFAISAGVKGCSSAIKYIFLIDGDIQNPRKHWLTELLLRMERHSADVVRGDPSYNPPLVQITVRPLLQLFFPEVAKCRQPLGGIVLMRREVAQGLEFQSGWGADIYLTIQVAKRKLAYEEVKIDDIVHAERGIIRGGDMADEIVATILKEANVLPATSGLRRRHQNS